jgi:hypothetical protein
LKFSDDSEVRVASIIALMMETVSTSETSVNFYQTTRRKNPEVSQLHTRRRENLKFHLGQIACDAVVGIRTKFHLKAIQASQHSANPLEDFVYGTS